MPTSPQVTRQILLVHPTRDPNDAFTGGQEVAFETPGQVPAVLDGPEAFVAVRFGPGHDAEVIDGGGVDRTPTDLTASFVDHDDGFGLLVGVDAEYDYGGAPL
jgi:hypothetical protein